MKTRVTTFMAFLIPFLMIPPCSARDFIVEFVAENYKESQGLYTNAPRVYHSIQVNSHAGPKLLILTGEDREYRKWLRHYIADNRQFIVKVPDPDNDRFISEKAFEIDVARLHPFSIKFWDTQIRSSKTGGGSVGTILGSRHILVIDTNDKRSSLISQVIRNMGYTATISRNGEHALELFRVQPEKFKMIIANHKAPGIETESFVEQVLQVDHQIPILIETGYRNMQTKKAFQAKFSGAGSVMLKPMVLKDLQKTIKELIKEPLNARQTDGTKDQSQNPPADNRNA